MEPAVSLKPLAVKRSTAAKMLDCGSTKVWELQKSGELETIKIGADDRITVASIERYVQRRVGAGGTR